MKFLTAVFYSFLLLFVMGCGSNTKPPAAEKSGIKKQSNQPIEVNKKQLMSCCVDSIIKGTQGKIQCKPLNFKITAQEKISAGSLSFNDTVTQKWLRIIAPDSAKGYLIKDISGTYYLFISPVDRPTGRMTNFSQWLLINIDTKKAALFVNLNWVPDVFYRNKKGILHFLVFDFAEEFYREEDYDNILFEITDYELKNGTAKKTGTATSHCYCQ